ncbi:Pyridine nucleotide-disulfide oxidoreductase [Botryosphaeria dothidea]|uniref:Pyridine nucleotide-disulfide oxidoreductase n=1 Tax=Botryosphaeria dothidea TaxID=55169 RepID=A0A8H4IUS3_9PEZI|nr:Pyridine nucleotide-disulfide oxidoreductase [Botryosphaeria dothidea]KAF4305523.1 Pyridine nucleotide-disulfide oxidoreductase [Botryosphaeria dothidea]
MGSIQNAPKGIREVDVLIIGAGFAAFNIMNRLRKQGLSIKIFEKGSGSGGIWHWNQYPGARVDSDSPIYQLFDSELHKGFTFKERYSDWKELKRYFQYVEQQWDLLKDIEYNRCVEGAQFDESKKKWLVECTDGTQVYCRWLIAAIGFAAKKYTPKINGLGDFQGELYHTAVWPQWGVNLKNKRIAVIGTGASGIQTIQEAGPQASHLTIYQRTPNYCLPMNQHPLDPAEEEKKKAAGEYDAALRQCYNTFAGFTYEWVERDTFDDTPEQREAFFHNLLIEQGGFKFWLGGYRDMLFDDAANDAAYDYWRRSVQRRVPDPRKAELLAPKQKPHPWGTKRPSLEQNFYEVVSLPHIDLVDVNAAPIQEITETGIRTADGELREFDMIVLATGFDAVTGSLGQLNIRNAQGESVAQHWRDGLRTAMGIALGGFPNFFYTYGPQAPTAFSNGPTCTAVQAEWIDRAVQMARKSGVERLEPKREAEEEWTRAVRDKWDNSLFPRAKSWYQGANIPGRRVEPLNWAGGMPAYIKALHDSLENGFQGWKTDVGSLGVESLSVG